MLERTRAYYDQGFGSNGGKKSTSACFEETIDRSIDVAYFLSFRKLALVRLGGRQLSLPESDLYELFPGLGKRIAKVYIVVSHGLHLSLVRVIFKHEDFGCRQGDSLSEAVGVSCLVHAHDKVIAVPIPAARALRTQTDRQRHISPKKEGWTRRGVLYDMI